MSRLTWVREQLAAVRRMPQVTIHLDNDTRGRNLKREFTSRHPRYKVIGRKTIGVALLPVPEDGASFLKGKSRQVLRTNLNRAKKAGYLVSEFTPANHVAEILAINSSAQDRQGRPMSVQYTDPEAVNSYCRSHASLLGVFGDAGLVAYLEPLASGEVTITNRILGHRDYLDNGIMYLLMLGAVEWCVNRRRQDPRARWLMYDMMLGAQPGLRYFKERIGFTPHRVRWRVGR